MFDKLKYVILSLLFYIFLLMPVYAEEIVEFKINPNKTTVSTGDTMKIDFVVKSNDVELTEGIVGCRFSITTDEGITTLRSSSTVSEGWILEDTVDEKNFVLKVKESALLVSSPNNNTTIYSVPFKIEKNGKINISNIACYRSNDNFQEIESKQVDVRISDLSSLTINGEDKVLDENIFYSEKNIDSTSFSLKAVATDESKQSLIKIYALDIGNCSTDNCDNLNKVLINECNGGECSIEYEKYFAAKKDLNSGNNVKEVKLSVYIGEQIVREKLIIQKEIADKIEENLLLSSLEVGSVKVLLNDNTNTYEVTLPSSTNDVEVKATLKDPENATFDDLNKPGVFNNKPTDINLVVKSKTGNNIKTYTIKIEYKDSTTTNNNDNNNKPDNPKPNNQNVNNNIVNPQTGGMIWLFVIIMLVISFLTTYYIYKNHTDLDEKK